MKHLLSLFRALTIMAMMLFSAYACASEPVDTIAFNSANIKEIIKDSYTNSKGKTITKYFFYTTDRQLIDITKTVYDRYNLCVKHNAIIELRAIVLKSNHKKIKKIIL